jgi:BirA family biotin operon repressor/biotin-[acetyl-CoA-carboxylase] ligase
MILKPKVDASLALKVTSMAAVAVCRTLKQTLNLESKIKWVNDVYLNNLKVCGILTEGVTGFESRKVETIVVGIGINYQEGEDGFPKELKEIATTLFKKGEKPTISKSELIGSLVASLRKLVDNLDDNSYIEEYRQSSLVIGKNVKVIQGEVEYEAIAEAIDDNGFLTVRLEDGTLKVLQSGEISIRKATSKSW